MAAYSGLKSKDELAKSKISTELTSHKLFSQACSSVMSSFSAIENSVNS